MKAIFFSFLCTFFFLQCQKHDPKQEEHAWIPVTGRLSYAEEAESLYLKSGKFTYFFSKKDLPLKRTVFLNASLIGFATELGLEEKILGVSSPEYIYAEKIHALMQSGQISDVGDEQKYDVEKILALEPDAVFTNYIASFENTYALLKNNGIKVIFLDDYLEQKPLEKSAYLQIFGKLFNKEKVGEEKYGVIKRNYNKLAQIAAKSNQKPLVLANEMYGSQWYMPGNETQLAFYLRDANSNYLGASKKGDKAIPLSFEEVFVKAESAEVWVNAGNHRSKAEMLLLHPAYAKMKIFQRGPIYAVTGRTRAQANDFFESGIVRADLILQDYVKMLHPELLPEKELIYFKKLD